MSDYIDNIAGNDDFLFFRRVDAEHDIYIGRNSGRFIIDYAVNDTDAPHDESFDPESESESGERRQVWRDSLQQAEAYIASRQKTAKRVKVAPLNLPCLREGDPAKSNLPQSFTAKGIHAGNGKLLVKESGVKVSFERRYGSHAGQGSIFPDHPFIAKTLTRILAHRNIIKTEEAAIEALYKTLTPFAIEARGTTYSGGSDETPEGFTEKWAQAKEAADAHVTK